MLAASAFDRILLIKLSAVGDIVHTLPVLAKLRTRFPRARIDWLVAAEHADLVRCHPALSAAVPFDRHALARSGRSLTALGSTLAALRDLRSRGYDLVIDLQGQVRSALLALASGAPVRLGFAATRERVAAAYTHRIPVPTLHAHAVDRNLRLAPLLGLDDAAPDLSLHVPPEGIAGADRLLAGAGLAERPFALLAPGTAWETKHWPAESFAAVGRQLHRDGLAVVLSGSPADAVRCRTVRAGCPDARDLCGRTTLAELAGLIRRATVCVTNDSGPMHVAVALGRPVVAVFGPTSRVRTGPYRQPDAAVSADVPCAPCYLRRQRDCRHAQRCLRELPPAAVVERVRAVLARPPAMTASDPG